MPRLSRQPPNGRPDHEAFIPCKIMQLPAERRVAAAQAAIKINSRNVVRPEVVRLITDLRGGVPPTADHLAMVTSKNWGSGGVDLTVSFLDNPTPALAAKILAHMNAWSKTANIRFRATAAGGQVRIARQEGQGYWSYLGTDLLHIDPSQQTMNLDSFSDSTPDSEFYRVVRHETGHCLSAGTLIDCPRDLEKYPLGIPISELVGQQPWVYAWKDSRVVIRKAERVWLSKKDSPTVRVRLRTGRGYHKGRFRPPLELVGTADHPVLLADGKTWKNLGDLKSGDRLCSLYRSKNGQRTRITWTGLEERVREHVFVAEQVYGDRPDGFDCHHRDENKMNQSVDNLEWKEETAHCGDHTRGRKRSPEAIAASASFWTGHHHTEKSRAKMSASHTGKKLSDETKAKMSSSTKGRKQSTELIEKRRQAMLRFYANGGRSGMFGKKTSDETRRKQSESGKRRRHANHIVVSVEPWISQDVYDMTVPDADSFVANGVVVHNSLGFPHEHLRRELVNRLDVQKTLAYFERTQNWSEAVVRSQVLTPLNEATLTATPHADQTSIMCYQLPGTITTDGQPIVGGADINDLDYAFAADRYPKQGGPGPGPGGPSGVTLATATAAVDQAVAAMMRKYPYYANVFRYSGQQIDATLAPLWGAQAAPVETSASLFGNILAGLSFAEVKKWAMKFLKVAGPLAVPYLKSLIDSLPQLTDVQKQAIDELIDSFL